MIDWHKDVKQESPAIEEQRERVEKARFDLKAALTVAERVGAKRNLQFQAAKLVRLMDK